MNRGRKERELLQGWFFDSDLDRMICVLIQQIW